MDKERQEMLGKKKIGLEEVLIAILEVLILIGTILIAIGGIYYDVVSR